jgi:NADP-dependent 3-hydroxy acid dehydrogenase YdfG
MCHFWIVRSFLPQMLARDEGYIVTIASSAGLFGQFVIHSFFMIVNCLIY